MSESFEDAMVTVHKYRLLSDKMCDRLKKAHEHDMEQRMREQYHRGYIAGQKSMDAEHYAVALRLRQLPLDEDSHGNLSQIARAVWHNDFGWTQGACKGLRDELIRLLGGVHDEPVSVGADCGACGVDCDCGAGKSRRVTYDELGNERHKAICELRKLPDWYPHDGKQSPAGKFNEALSDAIGVMGLSSFAKIRDRLIHLLGGNEPYSNLTRTSLEPNLPKSAETAKPESDDGGEVTITDELRSFISDRMTRCTVYTTLPDSKPETQLTEEGYKLIAIADRIDAQFKRLCWHQEAVLQSTIDTMADEAKRLEVQRHGFKSAFDSTRDMLDKRTDERDELRKELRKIADCVGVPHERDLSEYSDEAVIDSIYWRIDNIFKVDIEELQAQVADCCEQRDKAHAKAVNLRNSLCDTQRRVKVKCDELQRALNAIRAVVLDE